VFSFFEKMMKLGKDCDEEGGSTRIAITTNELYWSFILQEEKEAVKCDKYQEGVGG
jgi:hypothetical protein